MTDTPAITGFTNLYQRAVSGRPLLSSFLPGHLMVEFLLRKLVGRYDARLASSGAKLNFARLIEVNDDLGLITPDQKDVLKLINGIRNKLAHRITYEPTLPELKALWTKAEAAFSDFTDGISQGLDALDDAASVAALDGWVFSELFVQIAYDLHHEYIDRGGHEEAF